MRRQPISARRALLVAVATSRGVGEGPTAGLRGPVATRQAPSLLPGAAPSPGFEQHRSLAPNAVVNGVLTPRRFLTEASTAARHPPLTAEDMVTLRAYAASETPTFDGMATLPRFNPDEGQMTFSDGTALLQAALKAHETAAVANPFEKLLSPGVASDVTDWLKERRKERNQHHLDPTVSEAVLVDCMATVDSFYRLAAESAPGDSDATAHVASSGEIINVLARRLSAIGAADAAVACALSGKEITVAALREFHGALKNASKAGPDRVATVEHFLLLQSLPLAEHVKMDVAEVIDMDEARGSAPQITSERLANIRAVWLRYEELLVSLHPRRRKHLHLVKERWPGFPITAQQVLTMSYSFRDHIGSPGRRNDDALITDAAARLMQLYYVAIKSDLEAAAAGSARFISATGRLMQLIHHCQIFLGLCGGETGGALPVTGAESKRPLRHTATMLEVACSILAGHMGTLPSAQYRVYTAALAVRNLHRSGVVAPPPITAPALLAATAAAAASPAAAASSTVGEEDLGDLELDAGAKLDDDAAAPVTAAEALMGTSLQLLAAATSGPVLTVHQVLLVAEVLAQRPHECAAVIGLVACRGFPSAGNARTDDGKVSIEDQLKDAKGDDRRRLLKLCAVASAHLVQQLQATTAAATTASPADAEAKARLSSIRAFATAIHRGIDYTAVASPTQLAATLDSFVQCGLPLTKGIVGVFTRAMVRVLQDDSVAAPNIPTLRRIGELLPTIARVERAKAKAILAALIDRVDKAAGSSTAPKAAAFRALAPSIRMAGKPSMYPRRAMLHTAAVAQTAESYAGGKIHIDAAVDAIKLACAVAGPSAVHAVGPLAKLLPDNPELREVFEGPSSTTTLSAQPPASQPSVVAPEPAAAVIDDAPAPEDPVVAAADAAETAAAAPSAADGGPAPTPARVEETTPTAGAATTEAAAEMASAVDDASAAAAATVAEPSEAVAVAETAHAPADGDDTSAPSKDCQLTRMLQLSLLAASNGAGGLLSDADADELIALMAGTATEAVAAVAADGDDGVDPSDKHAPSSTAMQWGPKLAPVLAVVPAERRAAFIEALFDTQPALQLAKPEVPAANDNAGGDVEYAQGIEAIAALHGKVKEAAHGRNTLGALFNAHKKAKIAPSDIDAVSLADRIRAGLPPREISALWTQTVAPATATVARTSPLLLAIVLSLTPAAPTTTTATAAAQAETAANVGAADEARRPVVEQLDAANLLEALCVIRGARSAVMKLRDDLQASPAAAAVALSSRSPDEVDEAAAAADDDDVEARRTTTEEEDKVADDPVEEEDPAEAATALEGKLARIDRMLGACAVSETALTAAVRAMPEARFASAKVCVLRLPTLGVAMASHLIERCAASMAFNDLISTLHFLSNVVGIATAAAGSPADTPRTAAAAISEVALERVGARACALLSGATADEIGAALQPIARIAEWQQARQLKNAARMDDPAPLTNDGGASAPVVADEDEAGPQPAEGEDDAAMNDDDREMIISQCSFVRTLRAILRVDEITDRATLQKFLSRRAPPTSLIGPELERVLLPLIAGWTLFDALGATRDLRTKHQLTPRLTGALWERATALVFDDGADDDHKQAHASVLTLAKTFAEVGQLTGDRGLEIATHVSNAIERFEGVDATATLAELDALGVKPTSALYRRLTRFHDKDRIAHLRRAMAEHAILSTSELLDLITLYCHDQSTAGARAGPVDGFARLVAAYTHLATRLQVTLGEDEAAAATGDALDTSAAMTSEEGSEFTRLLQALSRSGEWPDAARSFVQARLNTQLQGMDSRALTNNLRAIAKDPALRDAYAPTMLERVLDTAHFLDLEEASVAAIGVAELDAEVNDLVLAAHDALCTRFTELMPRSGPGAAGESSGSGSSGPKRVVLLRFLEAMSVHGADWSALQALQGQLRRHARHLDGRHAATALQHLSKLYRPGVESALLLDLMHAVEADGSAQHMAVALVAAAEVPLALTDQIERMFGRVMFVRDVYVNNPALRAGLDVAAREYAPRLPTRITHAFVRASSRHASDQWEGMEW